MRSEKSPSVSTFGRNLIALVAMLLVNVAANAAVITYSTLQSEFDQFVLNQGWWSSGPGHSNYDGNDNHYTGLIDGDTLRSFYTFDLSNLSGTVTGATLRVHRGYQPSTVNLMFWDVTTAAAVVNSNKGLNPAIFYDLGSGISFGTFIVPTGAADDYLSFSLNSEALAQINSASGFFTIGASVGAGEVIFAHTGYDETYLDLHVPEPAALALMGLGLAGLGFVRRRA